MKTVCFSSSRI